MPFTIDRVKLVATVDTEKSIQTGRTPSWLMVRVNDDGTGDYYVNRETGRLLTFSLPDGAEDDLARWLHTLPTLDPMADDGAAAFYNLGLQLAKSHPLESVGQFFKKIWSRKGGGSDGDR
jgi:hypothetical protein